MSKPDPFLPPKREWPWTMEVSPGGMGCFWFVKLSHGCMTYGPDGGPFLVFGTRKRAERKGERVIRRYKAKEERRKRDTTKKVIE